MADPEAVDTILELAFGSAIEEGDYKSAWGIAFAAGAKYADSRAMLPPALSTTRTAEDVREALEPFARRANSYDQSVGRYPDSTKVEFTLGDCRRASAAIRNLDLSTLSIERGSGE